MSQATLTPAPSHASSGASAGAVTSIWRYPVKSMMGEEINATRVLPGGLLGDRAYALIDEVTGKVASAKNPAKWPDLFAYRAAFVAPPTDGATLPPVRITTPSGDWVSGDDPKAAEVLSAFLGRRVRLAAAVPERASLEEYWPDIEGLAHKDHVTDEAMPPGTFFDLATVHLLTTATLDTLRELYPAGRFEPRRFRPNLIVSPPAGQTGFVESAWIGKTIRLGGDVLLKITGPCPRCVMTTLAQGDLPKDPGILRTAAKYNQVQVGVYASVVSGGTVRRGDGVSVEMEA